MRILVTGARGFVGRYLTAALRERGHDVVEADRTPQDDVLPVDVTDALAVRAALDLVRPDAVAHLAAQAFVPSSIEDPRSTFAVNARGTLNLLEAARDVAQDGRRPRVLVVSSADVYGTQPAQAFPLVEACAPLPRSPYSASKVAAEAIAAAYARSYGVDVVVTRAFNHIGAGQDERFAIASFAAQVARVAAGLERIVWVGNLEAVRDILDVRDVCTAYALLLEGGGHAGEIYNVCSGAGISMRDVLRRLIESAHAPVEVRQHPDRMRPADVPTSVGDATKLRAATGWAPRVPLPAALREVYQDARARLVAATPG